MPLNRLLTLGVGACTAVALSVPIAAAPASAAPNHHHRSGGSLVLVGGALADGNAEIYGDIVRLAGGAGKARIGIFTAAAPVPSEDPDAGTPDCNNSVCNGDYYADLFKTYGVADAQWIPIDLDHPKAAEDPKVVAQISSMTGFFFGGGDQYRYVTTMTRGDAQRDTPALAAVRRKLREGAVVAGTSAGAQIMAGRDMITGGSVDPGLRDGAKPGYFDDSSVLGYLPKGGFGFFTAGLVDTHFSRRGREARSIRLAVDTHHQRVFGLDENTALEVTGVGGRAQSLRVLGQRGVSVLDLRRARVTDNAGVWGVEGVRWSRLTAGDAYRANGWRPVLAAGKTRVTGTDGPCTVPPSDDVFYDYGLVGLAEGLAEQAGCDAVHGTSYEKDPQWAAELTRGKGFAAYRGSGVPLSFTGVVIGISPA
ncbi:cyanophycinase [Micromonospora siamensis]|uniref:Cyanophycinase n=1 Tax=Micromonospora siamensis TaxID=299152 RepID=A0A1C5H6D0_9ACTN|nr:cyanophycinase [Micromonospora siamensis]SCG41457.1 cyanophycinase [Micromonospora siamensis]